MFTGIIETQGIVKAIHRLGSDRGFRIEIQAHDILDDLKLGDSVATNGVCLTASALTGQGFIADVMAQTYNMTNLGALRSGSKVNLERALRFSDRLGGHLVTGHIDEVGKIMDMKTDGQAIRYRIATSEKFRRRLIAQGSVSVDGISLTISKLESEGFEISTIPHTRDETTLGGYRIGDKVNLESDVIGKYIEQFVMGRGQGGETSCMNLATLEAFLMD